MATNWKKIIVGFLLLLSPTFCFGAIALDGVAGPTDLSNNTTKSLNITVAGTNRVLIASFYYNDQGPGTGVFSSATALVSGSATAMTKLGAVQAPNGVWGEMYGIVNPDTGTNTVTVTVPVSSPLGISAVSYTGVSQTGLPDSSNTASNAAGGFTISTTVVAANSWTVLSTANAVTVTAGTGSTVRVNDTSHRNYLFDSNGTVGTGSQSMTISTTDGPTADIIVSLAPAVTVVPTVFTPTFFNTFGNW